MLKQVDERSPLDERWKSRVSRKYKYNVYMRLKGLTQKKQLNAEEIDEGSPLDA